jgi:putative Holliday junction resolvase
MRPFRIGETGTCLLMRYLAIDLGQRRTGLATGDDETGMVFPAGQIAILASQSDRLSRAIADAAIEHGAESIVVGLPVNMDGSEGEAAKRTRAFGDALSAVSKLPVHYQDERLTSFAADQSMARSGRTRGQKKELRDALAAAQILRDFLENQRNAR